MESNNILNKASYIAIVVFLDNQSMSAIFNVYSKMINYTYYECENLSL